LQRRYGLGSCATGRALDIWKPEIKNDDVGRLSKKFERVFAVGCLDNMIAMCS
jgi:hypothetical protein